MIPIIMSLVFIFYYYYDIFLSTLQVKIWLTPNGVLCSSSKLLICSNPLENSFVIDSSECCLVSKPLHIIGPLVEKEEIITYPSSLTCFLISSTYFRMSSSSVRKWNKALSCHTSYLLSESNSLMSQSIQFIESAFLPSLSFERSSAFEEISNTVMFLKPRSSNLSARFESPPPTSIILASLLGVVDNIRSIDVFGYC